MGSTTILAASVAQWDSEWKNSTIQNSTLGLTEMKNASIWCAYQEKLASPFWDMAPLTPLLWQKFSFLDRFHLGGWNYGGKWYYYFLVPYCIIIMQKLHGNPEKNSKKTKLIKSWQKSYLLKEMYWFCDMSTLCAHFLHFSRDIKIWNFSSKFWQQK